MSATVFWSYVVTLILWLAGLLQLAVILDRTIHLSRASTSSRWVISAGMFGLAGRFTYYILDHGQLAVPLHSLLSIGCIGIGLISLELPRFAHFHFMDTQPGQLIDDIPQDRRHAERRHDRRNASVHTTDERTHP